jgi:hypothetical protein
VAALDDEMSCHGETHDAETEKSDFSHMCNPGVRPAHWWPGMIVKGTVNPRNGTCQRIGNAAIWRAGVVL